MRQQGNVLFNPMGVIHADQGGGENKTNPPPTHSSIIIYIVYTYDIKYKYGLKV